MRFAILSLLSVQKYVSIIAVATVMAAVISAHEDDTKSKQQSVARRASVSDT